MSLVWPDNQNDFSHIQIPILDLDIKLCDQNLLCNYKKKPTQIWYISSFFPCFNTYYSQGIVGNKFSVLSEFMNYEMFVAEY